MNNCFSKIRHKPFNLHILFIVHPNDVQPLCVNRECNLILYLWSTIDFSITVVLTIYIYKIYITIIIHKSKCT